MSCSQNFLYSPNRNPIASHRTRDGKTYRLRRTNLPQLRRHFIDCDILLQSSRERSGPVNKWQIRTTLPDMLMSSLPACSPSYALVCPQLCRSPFVSLVLTQQGRLSESDSAELWRSRR
ncbi:hypothetical protein J6590_003632 [Homalodisca vitripennis]|nr:hypothetical protein J6590_003632 [Homalodisca vitripennis]